MSVTVSMTVNGKFVSGEVKPRTLLVQFLCDHLGLTGTHAAADYRVHLIGVMARRAVEACG